MKRLIWLFLVPCLWLTVWAAEPLHPVAYRITGFAVSSRDGSRIPYCKFEVSEGRPLSEDELSPGRGPRAGGGPQRRNDPAGQRPAEVSADVHGHFQIDLPGPGRWRIRGFARNFRIQDYDAHDGFFSSIILTPAKPAMDVVFKLVPDGAITGMIRDDAGEAVRNAQVVAEYQPADHSRGAWRSVGFAQTDDRGRYEISGLAPDGYRVRVQAQPWYARAGTRRFSNVNGISVPAQSATDPALDVVYAPVWFPGVDDDSRAEPIQLGAGEERQADFTLLPIPATHLKIARTDSPPAADNQPRPQRGAVVTKIFPAGGFGPTMSTTDGSESDYGGLSPGVYEVRQIGSDGRVEEGVRQLRVLPGGGGVIDLGSTQPLVRVRLVTEGVPDLQLNEVLFVDTATGRSITSNGRMLGLELARARARDEAPRERATYLAPGTYEVYLPAGGTNVLTGLTATGAVCAGSTVQITDGSPTLTLHIAAGKGEVSGRVLADAKPVGEVMVLLVPASLGQPGDLTPIRRDQTNTDGGYLIRAAVPGRYILVAIQNGWGLKWQDPSTLIPYLNHGTPVEISADGKPVLDLMAQQP